MWALEHFEKESIQSFQKLKRGHKFHDQVHARKWQKKLSPKHAKKTFVGTLKTGTKLVGAGLLMGASAKITGHISSQAQDVEEGSQVIRIEDWGPSIACFDSVDATTDSSKAPHYI